MRDLAKSMLRLTLATSLVGVRGCGSLLGAFAAAGRPRASTAAADELLRLAFHAGDDLQEEWVDLAWEALRPRGLDRVAETLGARWADAIRFAAPTEGGELARLELANKLEVFRWVRTAGALLDPPPAGEGLLLARALARAARLGSRRELWVIEGLGHRHVEGLLRERAGALEGRVFPDAGRGAALPILHAGMGMALAEHALAALPREPSADRVRGALADFFALCLRASRPEHGDAAREALGLMARCFFPHLVPALSEGLEGFEEGRWVELFWHGVGRGLYFVPIHLLPGLGSVEHVLSRARREAPGERAEAAAEAGVGYAFALVNLSRPEILGSLLCRRGGEILHRPFGEGLGAACHMRRRVTADDPDLEAFLTYRPARSELAQAWEEWATSPVAGGLYRSLGPRAEAMG